MFTPASLFNINAHQNPQFWSLLGYLPNAANYRDSSATNKLKDYHLALAYILKQLQDMQHSHVPLQLNLVYTKKDNNGNDAQ
jgi:hypothetical protein